MNNMSNNRKSNSNNSFKCSEVYGNGMRSRGAVNRSNNYNQSVASRDRNQNSKNNMGQNKYGRVNNTLQKNFNKALYEGMYAEKKIERNFDPRLQQIYRANNANKNQNNKAEQGKILNLRNSEPVASSVNNKKRNNVNNRAKMVETKNNINNASNNKNNLKKSGVNDSFNMANIKNSFNRNSIGDAFNKNSLNKNIKSERVQFNRNFNNVQEKKNKTTEKTEYTDMKNITSQLDDGQEAFPKSIFVFITVAVIFVAALIYYVANNDGVENTVDKLVNKATQNKIVQKEDRGLDLRGELDSSQFLADSREEDNVTSMFSGNAEASEQNNKSTVKTGEKTEESDKKKTTTTSKNDTTSNNTSSSGTNNESSNAVNNSNDTVNSNTNNNQVSNDDASNEEENEEENEEVVEEAPTPTFYMPLEVTGMLYHCSYGFASYGADTGFQRYTNFIKSGAGVRVPTKDVDGIWIDVRGAKVIDYIGYKNGSRTTVVKINIEDAMSASVKTIYAIKGTYIPLEGSYRKKDGTSTFRNMFASEDVELIKVGI